MTANRTNFGPGPRDTSLVSWFRWFPAGIVDFARKKTKDFAPGWFYRWTWKRRVGSRAETLAARFLKKGGLRIIGRNVTVPGVGELDILAREGDTLAVVEVRSRVADSAQLPLDSVAAAKRERILKATSWLIRRYGLAGVTIRQDIVAIAWDSGNRIKEIVHIRDAFRPD